MIKNMNIEINSEQPLDEVVKELERLGYVKDKLSWDNLIKWHSCTFRQNNIYRLTFVVSAFTFNISENCSCVIY